MKYLRTKLVTDAAGARRRIKYTLPYADLRKGETCVVRGNRRRISTFRGTLSRHAARFNKTFITRKLGTGRIQVFRWY